jgi:hypothetical protein
MSDPSPELLAANERLLALRAQLARQQAGRPNEQPAANDRQPGNREANEQPEATSPTSPAPTQPPVTLPVHLGWDSPAVTAAIRARQERQPAPAEYAAVAGSATEPNQAPCPIPPPIPEPDAGTSDCSLFTTDVSPLPASLRQAQGSLFTIHPSLALALLRQQQVATGRLWLLLRALDDEGRGWLERADIEAAFTNPDSPSQFCTTRYLRQLLAAGEGLFWQREGSDARPELAERASLEPAERKVWLRSQAKVAAALGIGRLRGRAVELPVAILLGPIGDLRAHLYASFHSSRGEGAGPISRESLRQLSGVSPRTQQSYDARAEVEVQPCLAMGGLATAGSTQSHAWQHGRAAFTFIDHQGKQGAAGSSYQAHRLPNRYIGPHRRLTGKPKRLNRQLIDLRHKGYAGNGQPLGLSPKSMSDGLLPKSMSDELPPKSLVGGTGSNGSRRYYADGAAAGRVWLR